MEVLGNFSISMEMKIENGFPLFVFPLKMQLWNDTTIIDGYLIW